MRAGGQRLWFPMADAPVGWQSYVAEFVASARRHERTWLPAAGERLIRPSAPRRQVL